MHFRFVLVFLLLSMPVYAGYWGCHRFNLPGWWGDAEYMLIWRSKRFFPPLVTTNVLGNEPILGVEGTEILFGDEHIRKCPQSGFKGDIGVWLLPCLGFGVGGFGVACEHIRFFAEGVDGVPILGRPFFDVSGGAPVPAFDPISFPAVPDVSPAVSGDISIKSDNSLWGVDAYARMRLLNIGCTKLDVLGGAMYTSIRDTLRIDTNQEATFLFQNVDLAISDNFVANNNFYGGMVGILAEVRSQNWGVMATGKVGIGTNFEKVDIEGTTTIFDMGMPVITFPFGFLTLPTNIGTHKSQSCEMVYRADIQAQLRIWCNFWLTVGYAYMFWPKVQLAGEAVDLNLNLLQFVGIPIFAPEFKKVERRFFAQGFTAGLYILF